jgi:hypothetical protein
MAGGNNSLGYLRQINEKMDRLLAIAERYVGVPVAVEVAAAPAEAAAAAEPAAAAAAAAAARPRISIQTPTAQGSARTLRRLLERGVEASERPKIEKQIRDLQPKIDLEIAAKIPIESEFQSQYDGVLSQLTYEGLKPVMRAKMEKIRNDLKAKLNAEKEHGIARGGSKKRKRKSSKKTKSRRN